MTVVFKHNIEGVHFNTEEDIRLRNFLATILILMNGLDERNEY